MTKVILQVCGNAELCNTNNRDTEADPMFRRPAPKQEGNDGYIFLFFLALGIGLKLLMVYLIMHQ